MKALFVVLGVCSVAAAGFAADQPTASILHVGGATSLVSEGELQSLRGSLSPIFGFRIQSGKLLLNRDAWIFLVREIDRQNAPRDARDLPQGLGYDSPKTLRFLARRLERSASNAELEQSLHRRIPPLHRLFLVVQQQARPESVDFLWPGPTFSNNDEYGEWRSIFKTDTLAGQLTSECGPSPVDIRKEVLTVGELTVPVRTLELELVRDRRWDRLRITLSNSTDSVSMEQSPDDSFSITTTSSGESTTRVGESFVALIRKYRPQIEADVLPVFEQFGICPVLQPANPAVRKTVLKLLLRTPETQEKAIGFLADLATDDAERRSRAEHWLTTEFPRCQDLVLLKLQEKRPVGNEHTSLDTIINGNSELRRVAETVAAFDLLHDAQYITTLLDEADPIDCLKLMKHLKTLTGQKLGLDPAAWKDWASNQK